MAFLLGDTAEYHLGAPHPPSLTTHTHTIVHIPVSLTLWACVQIRVPYQPLSDPVRY